MLASQEGPADKLGSVGSLRINTESGTQPNTRFAPFQLTVVQQSAKSRDVFHRRLLMHQLSVSLPDSQSEALKVLAEAGHRSLASVIRELLADALDKKQPEAKA